MPGNIIRAECLCDYNTTLRPGCIIESRKSLVMIYRTDVRELSLEDEIVSKNRHLQILEDPFYVRMKIHISIR